MRWIGTVIDDYRRQLQSSRWCVQKQSTTSLDGELSARLEIIPVEQSRFDAIHLTTVTRKASREIYMMHRHISPSARARRRTTIRRGWPMWTLTSSRVRSVRALWGVLFQGKSITPAGFDVYEPWSGPRFHPNIVLAF